MSPIAAEIGSPRTASVQNGVARRQTLRTSATATVGNPKSQAVPAKAVAARLDELHRCKRIAQRIDRQRRYNVPPEEHEAGSSTHVCQSNIAATACGDAMVPIRPITAYRLKSANSNGGRGLAT